MVSGTLLWLFHTGAIRQTQFNSLPVPTSHRSSLLNPQGFAPSRHAPLPPSLSLSLSVSLSLAKKNARGLILADPVWFLGSEETREEWKEASPPTPCPPPPHFHPPPQQINSREAARRQTTQAVWLITAVVATTPLLPARPGTIEHSNCQSISATISMAYRLRRLPRVRQTWVRFPLSLCGIFRVEPYQRLQNWYSCGYPAWRVES